VYELYRYQDARCKDKKKKFLKYVSKRQLIRLRAEANYKW